MELFYHIRKNAVASMFLCKVSKITGCVATSLTATGTRVPSRDHTVVPTLRWQRWHSRLYPGQLKLVLDLATQRVARLSWLGYIPRWYIRPKRVTHHSTNRAQRTVTTFTRRTTLPLCQAASVQMSSIGVNGCYVVTRELLGLHCRPSSFIQSVIHAASYCVHCDELKDKSKKLDNVESSNSVHH